MENSIVFYKDSVDKFECDIKIDGASSSKAKTRLVLEFKDKTLLFNGAISNGHVSVNIPRLTDIEESTGKAILEVIVEQSYFEAWSSPFDLKNKKSVSVNEVTINSAKKSVVVENVSKINQQKEKTKKPSILKESCTQRNIEFVEREFNTFRSLNENKKDTIKRELKNFKPNNVIKQWANEVFNDPSTTYAKYCMMSLQNRRNK